MLKLFENCEIFVIKLVNKLYKLSSILKNYITTIKHVTNVVFGLVKLGSFASVVDNA